MSGPVKVDRTAILALVNAYIRGHSHMRGFACCSAHAVADAVPALLAEVDRLREALARDQRLYAAYRKGAAEAGRTMRAEITKARAAGLLDAAEIVGNDDDCECGGCDTCIPRALARQIRDRAYSVARGGVS